MPLAHLEEDDTDFGFSPGLPPNGAFASSAHDYTTANESKTFPRLTVDDLPPAYNMPADATERVIHETARTVMGLSALIDLKIDDVNKAIARLEAADKAIAGDIRGGVDSNKRTSEALKSAGDLHVRAADTINATLRAQHDATTSLKSTVAELAGMQVALCRIGDTLSQQEQRAVQRHQEAQEALRSDGDTTRQAVQETRQEIVGKLVSGNQDTATRLTATERELMLLGEAVAAGGKATAQHVTNAVNAIKSESRDAHSATVNYINDSRGAVLAKLNNVEVDLRSFINQTSQNQAKATLAQLSQVQVENDALHRQIKRNAAWSIVLLVLIVALLCPVAYHFVRPLIFK